MEALPLIAYIVGCSGTCLLIIWLPEIMECTSDLRERIRRKFRKL